MAKELDVLKEIPGYKAILKSVLKSQIQMLIEQLSDQTGEESIILTASVNDGSLSHLGSSTGKGFLEGRDEIKAEFLGYCLKSQHRRESMEAESQQYNRSRTLMPPARRQRPRIRPAPYSISSPGSSSSVTSSPSFPLSSQHAIGNINQSNKQEPANVIDTFLESVTNEANSDIPGVEGSPSTQITNQNDSFDSSQSSHHNEHGDSVQTIKVERNEDDDDLEVTGMEMGDNSMSSSENWGQSYGSSGQNDRGQTDQSSLNGSEQTQEVATSHNVNFGGIAFPGLDNAHHDFSSRLPDMSPAELKQALYPQGLFKNSANGSPANDLQTNHVSVQGQFDPSPRKRGRPRKLPSLHPVDSSPPPMPASSPSSQNNQENDIPNDNHIRRRGRPRKDVDEALPPGVVRPMGISIGNGYVKCNVCAKILKATSMFSHKQSHLGIRNYGCEYCGKSFTQKGPLITHKRVHTGEKPYSCQRCGKAFAAHSGLYQHGRRCARNAALEHYKLTM